MNRAITQYASLIFDCDGVVLDSNKVKTDAFYRTSLPYGEAAARAMVNYHVANGGISRYQKFAYFRKQIVAGMAGPDIDVLLRDYAANVRQGLLTCAVANRLGFLRRHTSLARWFIVSGGDQAELRDIFVQRGIAKWFDGGIFGSPDSKEVILARETRLGSILAPALFLGDSKYDYTASQAAGMDFVFLSAWSEVSDWGRWVAENGIYTKPDVGSLLD